MEQPNGTRHGGPTAGCDAFHAIRTGDDAVKNIPSIECGKQKRETDSRADMHTAFGECLKFVDTTDPSRPSRGLLGHQQLHSQGQPPTSISRSAPRFQLVPLELC